MEQILEELAPAVFSQIYIGDPTTEREVLPKIFDLHRRLLPNGEFCDEPDRWLAWNTLAAFFQRSRLLNTVQSRRLGHSCHYIAADALPDDLEGVERYRVLFYTNALECTRQLTHNSPTPRIQLFEDITNLRLHLALAIPDDSITPTDSDTIHMISRARFQLALAEADLVTPRQAVDGLIEAHKFRESHLGDSHPDTIRARNSRLYMAYRLISTDTHDPAEILEWCSTALASAVLLPPHEIPNILGKAAESIILLYAVGDLTGGDAAELLRRFVEFAGFSDIGVELARFLAEQQAPNETSAVALLDRLMSASTTRLALDKSTLGDADRIQVMNAVDERQRAALRLTFGNNFRLPVRDDLLQLVPAGSALVIPGLRTSVIVYRNKLGEFSHTDFDVSEIELRRVAGLEPDFRRLSDLTLGEVFWGDLAAREDLATREELFDKVSAPVVALLGHLGEALNRMELPTETPVQGLGWWSMVPVHLLECRPPLPPRKPRGRIAVVVGNTDGLRLVPAQIRVISHFFGEQFIGTMDMNEVWRDPSRIASADVVHVIGHLDFHPGDPLGAPLAAGDEEAAQAAVRQEMATLQALLASGRRVDASAVLPRIEGLLHSGSLTAASVRSGALGDLTGQAWVLTACSAGGAHPYIDSERLGWAGALRTAGADQVVASQWKVLEVVCFAFTLLFYRSGGPKSNDTGLVPAVRTTMREMSRTKLEEMASTVLGDSDLKALQRQLECLPHDSPFAHPIRWGAFMRAV